MYIKHRVQNFWKYFILNREELEHALRENDHHEITHLLQDLNEHLKTICACGMEVEMSDTGFYEMTFTPQGNKNAQFATALLKKDAPQALSEDWIINAVRPPLSERAMHTILRIKDKEVTGADFHVYYTINEISKTLDIKVYCEALKDVEEKRRESMVAFMLELFIGELDGEGGMGGV